MNTDFEWFFLPSNEETDRIILYIGGETTPSEADELKKRAAAISGIPFHLCAVNVSDWDSFLTPWPAVDLLPGRAFSGKARELLSWIENEVMPGIRGRVGDGARIIAAGYSLAGLYSLWATLEGDGFMGAVSGSGSLWYTGWLEYLRSRKPDKKLYFDLSLGKKEPKARSAVMARVGEATEETVSILTEALGPDHVSFRLNDGGHFNDPEGRMAKGIANILKMIG